MTKETLEVLSLGAGVQSSVMALKAARGELSPMPDCAIFADTQFEPLGVYQHLDWLEKQLPFPVHRVSAGNIRDDHLNGLNTTGQRFAAMPLHTEKGGIGRRQCTKEYKVDPITKKIRDLMGLVPRQRGPKKVVVQQWIGISTDEAIRMKPNRIKWIENVWPLIDAKLSRVDCLKWFEKNYPGQVLAKSACIPCPYHNNAMWRDMKINDPVSFAAAVEFDNAIRLSGASVGNMLQKQFVHRSLKPLSEVDFRNLEDMGQINLFNNECEGLCGV